VNTLTTLYGVMDGPLPFGEFRWAVTKPEKTAAQENFKILERVCVFLLALVRLSCAKNCG